MGPADGLPKERAGCPQVRSADFLEHEGHIGRSRCFQFRSTRSQIGNWSQSLCAMEIQCSCTSADDRSGSLATCRYTNSRRAMSALPLKADKAQACGHVRFVPRATQCIAAMLY